MKKEIRPGKLRDMVRSLLPSIDRKGARRAKTANKRRVRRRVRAALHSKDFDETSFDFMEDANQRHVVFWRRSADKVAPFMRWCHSLTRGLPTAEALSRVRSIVPKNVIGYHAYSHWESERRRPYRYDKVSYREEQRRKAQSQRDRLRNGLRCLLEADPNALAELNEAIKSRKASDEPRRLLLGIHDVDAFVDEVLDACRYRVELNVLNRAVANATARSGANVTAFTMRIRSRAA